MRTTLRQALCSSSILLLLSLLSLICIPLTTTMVKTQAVNATEVAYVLTSERWEMHLVKAGIICM
jgi:hypothetical protein